MPNEVAKVCAKVSSDYIASETFCKLFAKCSGKSWSGKLVTAKFKFYRRDAQQKTDFLL